MGLAGSLPDVFVEIEVEYYLLKRLLGVKTLEGEKAAKVSKMKKDETLMVNIGSTSTAGEVRGRVHACNASLRACAPPPPPHPVDETRTHKLSLS
jgi:translation initiation factor 2 gamma subunit (eIF-2gamma)